VLFDMGVVVSPDIFLDIVTLSFTAAGGDQYFFDFTQTINSLGELDQEVLTDYLTNVLGGQVLAAQYPEGGEGRILSSVPTAGMLALMLAGFAGVAGVRAGRKQR